METKEKCECPHCGYEGDDFESGVILDPFCGTATTGLRALQLERKFIGVDGNADYVAAARARLSAPPLFNKAATEGD